MATPPEETVPPTLSAVARAPQRPVGIPADWVPRCPMLRLTQGRRVRCSRLLVAADGELDQLTCPLHRKERWFVDDESLHWGSPQGRLTRPQTEESTAVHCSLNALHLTALDRARDDLNMARTDLLREALLAHPRVAYHLEKVKQLAEGAPEERAEELALGVAEALTAAREAEAELRSRIDAIPIGKLGLTESTFTCLKREGIDTVGQLGALSIKEMLEFYEFPFAGIGEVKAALKRLDPARSSVAAEVVARVETATATDFTRRISAMRNQVTAEKIVALRDVKRLAWEQIAAEAGMRVDSVRKKYWAVKGKTLMTSPLEDLDFRTRTIRRLAAVGIRTVGDLIARSESDLCEIEGFGPTMLAQVRASLVQYAKMVSMENGSVPPGLVSWLRAQGDRDIIWLREQDKLTFTQIGTRLGCSKCTARNKYRIAIERRDRGPRVQGMSRRVWRERYGDPGHGSVSKLLGSSPERPPQATGKPSS